MPCASLRRPWRGVGATGGAGKRKGGSGQAHGRRCKGKKKRDAPRGQIPLAFHHQPRAFRARRVQGAALHGAGEGVRPLHVPGLHAALRRPSEGTPAPPPLLPLSPSLARRVPRPSNAVPIIQDLSLNITAPNARGPEGMEAKATRWACARGASLNLSVKKTPTLQTHRSPAAAMTTPDRAARGAEARRVVTGVEMRAERAADMVWAWVARGAGGRGEKRVRRRAEAAADGQTAHFPSLSHSLPSCSPQPWASAAR
jgi:hypothetical protein